MTKENAIIIPCYNVREHIVDLIARIPSNVADCIYVVDDCCPQQSGKLVQTSCTDARVKVIFNERNLGVGGAVKRGFIEACKDGFRILIKMDGDGQMNPLDIPKLIKPLKEGFADYTKSNRFFSPRALKGMPTVRLIGNGALSFLTKLSSGYWHVMDPTNGFLAIHSNVFAMLELERIDDRFFFESDLLCRLHLIDAVVEDVPIPAHYGHEESNLQVRNALFSFARKHLSRTVRRIIYDYFVRDFNVGSVQLVFGLILFVFGLVFGISHWINGLINHMPTEVGTIMLAILPTILGFQLLLSAINYDIAYRTKTPLHKLI